MSFDEKKQGVKEFRSLQKGDIALESCITNVQRGEMGLGGNFRPIDRKDEKELIIDIDLFIQSISICIRREKFGLLVEFFDFKLFPT